MTSFAFVCRNPACKLQTLERAKIDDDKPPICDCGWRTVLSTIRWWR